MTLNKRYIGGAHNGVFFKRKNGSFYESYQ